MLTSRLRSRWGLIAAAIYLGLALVAAVLALQRLAISTEMPGLAAWELLVLGLPWTWVLATPFGRRIGGMLLVAVVLGSVAVNAGLVYIIGIGLGRFATRHVTRA